MELELPPDEFDDQIDLFLTYDPDDGDVEFEVGDMELANRIVWRIRQYRTQRAEAVALYLREKERLDLWLDAETERIDRQTGRLSERVEAFHRSLVAHDKRRLTVNLPAGTLKARKAPDQWDIDDAALLAWAEENKREELIRRQDPEVDRSATKKALKLTAKGDDWTTSEAVDPKTGERVPGVTVVRGQKRYSVDTPEVTDG